MLWLYFDDNLSMSKSTPHSLQVIKQLHVFGNEGNLKLEPETSFLMLLSVKYLGDEINFNTIKPIQSKKAAIYNIASPTTKFELMNFIGSMNFNSKYTDKHHVNMKPL